MADLAQTDFETMISDGLRTGQPVKLESLAAAIRKAAPPPSGVNIDDRELVKRAAAANPHLGLDQLAIDIPDAAPVATPAAQPKPTAQPSPSWLDEAVVNPAKNLYSGLMTGAGKFANTLANVMDVTPGVGIMPNFTPGHNPIANMLRESGRQSTAMGTAAIPQAKHFADPIYRGFGAAIPAIATYAPAAVAGPAAPLVMGGIGAMEEADTGSPMAMAQSGLTSALMGQYLGVVSKVPGLKKLLFAGAPNVTLDLVQGLHAGLPPEQILQNMVASGTTMAGLVGANPGDALAAIKEAARLTGNIRVPSAIRKAGSAWQESIAPLPKTATPPQADASVSAAIVQPEAPAGSRAAQIQTSLDENAKLIAKQQALVDSTILGPEPASAKKVKEINARLSALKAHRATLLTEHLKGTATPPAVPPATTVAPPAVVTGTPPATLPTLSLAPEGGAGDIVVNPPTGPVPTLELAGPTAVRPRRARGVKGQFLPKEQPPATPPPATVVAPPAAPVNPPPTGGGIDPRTMTREQFVAQAVAGVPPNVPPNMAQQIAGAAWDAQHPTPSPATQPTFAPPAAPPPEVAAAANIHPVDIPPPAQRVDKRGETYYAPGETPPGVHPVRLPSGLEGAKPRYSYGEKQFTLTFSNDIDRAAYITAQPNLSKQDAAYLKFAMDATGLSEGQIRAHGAAVREAIKQQARSASPGDIHVPTQSLNIHPVDIPSPPAVEAPTVKAAAPPAKPGLLQRVDQAGQESSDWLKSQGFSFGGQASLNAFLDPQVVYHVSRSIAGDVARGALKFNDFASQMVKSFGPEAARYARVVWDKTLEHLKSLGAAAPGAGLTPPEAASTAGSVLPPTPPIKGQEWSWRNVPERYTTVATAQGPVTYERSVDPSLVQGRSYAQSEGEGTIPRWDRIFSEEGIGQVFPTAPPPRAMPLESAGAVASRLAGRPTVESIAKANQAYWTQWVGDQVKTGTMSPEEAIRVAMESISPPPAGPKPAPAPARVEAPEVVAAREREAQARAAAIATPRTSLSDRQLEDLTARGLTQEEARRWSAQDARAEQDRILREREAAARRESIRAGRPEITPTPPAESIVPRHSMGEALGGSMALEEAGFIHRARSVPVKGSRIRVPGSSVQSFPPVKEPLPSGMLANEVWVKPVADGVIEVQRQASTGEWEATKHYADLRPVATTGAIARAPVNPERGISERAGHGVGLTSLTEFLNGAQWRESPVPIAQKAGGRSGIGGEAFSSNRLMTAEPPTPLPEPSLNERLAAAEAHWERASRPAQTTGELQQAALGAALRERGVPALPEGETPAAEKQLLAKAHAQYLLDWYERVRSAEDAGLPRPPLGKAAVALKTPKVKRAPPVEQLGQAASEIAAAKGVKDPRNLSRVIASAVERIRKTTPPPPPVERTPEFQPTPPTSVPEGASFEIPGRGTYIPLTASPDGAEMGYMFMPKGGQPVGHSMPMDKWMRLRTQGEPIEKPKEVAKTVSTGKTPVLPADLPLLDVGGKPSQKRVRVSGESPFAVNNVGEGTDSYVVTLKGGKDTDIFIRREPGEKVYKIYQGNKLVQGDAPILTVASAKVKAVQLAEQRAAAQQLRLTARTAAPPKGQQIVIKPPTGPVPTLPLSPEGGKTPPTGAPPASVPTLNLSAEGEHSVPFWRDETGTSSVMAAIERLGRPRFPSGYFSKPGGGLISLDEGARHWNLQRSGLGGVLRRGWARGRGDGVEVYSLSTVDPLALESALMEASKHGSTVSVDTDNRSMVYNTDDLIRAGYNLHRIRPIRSFERQMAADR